MPVLANAEPPASRDEFITVKEFAQRVHRSPITVWAWIRKRQMPDGTVFMVHGHREINWTRWQKVGPTRLV